MNQKRCSLVLIGFLLLSFLVGIVSAAATYTPSNSQLQQNMESIIQKMIDILYPISSAVLGQDNSSTQFFFARVLLFMIILFVLYLALYTLPVFEDNIFILWVVNIAIAVLATRFFLSDEWVRAIILPYAALGVTITAGLPFVIYFMIINIQTAHKTTPLIRKTAWIFFGVIFIGLWISRTDLQQDNVIWIYPGTAALAFIMAVMDGTIHKFFMRASLQKTMSTSRRDRIRELKRDLIQLDKDVTTGAVPRDEYTARKKEIQKLVGELSKGT